MPRALGTSQPPVGQYFTMNPRSQQARGLIAWYPTIGLQSPNGTLRNFARPGAFPGVPTATSIVTQPVVGGAISLDGSTSHIDCGVGCNTTTGAITVSFWVNRISRGTFPNIVSRHNFGTGDWNFIYADDLDTCAIYFLLSSTANLDSNTDSGAFTPMATSLNTWYHVCGVASLDAGVACYLNGLGSSNSLAGAVTNISGNQTRIGGRVDGSQMLNGYVADVRIYDRAMSPQEVFQLYNPQTRWELYSPAKRRTLFAISGGILQTASYAGTLGTGGQPSYKIFKSVSGVLSSSGGVVKSTTKTAEGTLTSSGLLVKQLNKPFAGILSTTGDISSRSVSSTKAGILSSIGIITKSIATTKAGTFTTSGDLSGLKAVTAIFSGVLGSSGALVMKQVNKAVSGILPTQGAITNTNVYKLLSGILTTNGIIHKLVTKSIGGTLNLSGTLRLRINKTFSGIFTAIGDMIGVLTQGIPAPEVCAPLYLVVASPSTTELTVDNSVTMLEVVCNG